MAYTQAGREKRAINVELALGASRIFLRAARASRLAPFFAGLSDGSNLKNWFVCR